MSEWYYDENGKEFNELRLRQLTIEEFVINILIYDVTYHIWRMKKKKYIGLSFVYLCFTRIKLNWTYPRLWMNQLGKLNYAIFYLNKDLN